MFHEEDRHCDAIYLRKNKLKGKKRKKLNEAFKHKEVSTFYPKNTEENIINSVTGNSIVKKKYFRKKKLKQWAIVSNQIEVFIPCSFKLNHGVPEVTKLAIDFMRIAQDPFSVDIYAPKRWQVLQDQQPEAHCHTPVPSSTVKQTKFLVSSQIATFLPPVSMSALQWLLAWLFSLEGKCSFAFYIHRFKPYTYERDCPVTAQKAVLCILAVGLCFNSPSFHCMWQARIKALVDREAINKLVFVKIKSI